MEGQSRRREGERVVGREAKMRKKLQKQMGSKRNGCQTSLQKVLAHRCRI